MIEPLLLSTTHISTFNGAQLLTRATGFYFEDGGRLFLVTSRHVFIDEPSGHHPDRIEIDLHTDKKNVAASTGFSIPLYESGKALWHQGADAGGSVDVAAIEVDRAALPDGIDFCAFTHDHILDPTAQIEIGRSVLVVGFPLGFHDTLHHLPVVRHAIISSTIGLRFQGEGYFLTDGRTHRGSSGAPVVMRVADGPLADSDLPWMLLGVHSARLDIGTRDIQVDEALGLNCAWYADILLTLTGQ